METEIIVVPKILELESPKLNTNSCVGNSVKSNLEIIVLSLLYKKPMCGYDLIKEIFAKYNVLLSQGTVYPFLYYLKKENIVNVGYSKGDMRTKMYFCSQEGRQIIEKRINEFIEAEEYILGSLKNEFPYV